MKRTEGGEADQQDEPNGNYSTHHNICHHIEWDNNKNVKSHIHESQKRGIQKLKGI